MIKLKTIIFLTFISFLSACSSSDSLTDGMLLVYTDKFESLDNWIPEVQKSEHSSVKAVENSMEINVSKGATIWFKHKLSGDVVIKYNVVVVDQGGVNDRVSDMNCFWMAIDPKHPSDLFKSDRKTTGHFHDYNPLKLYYVGLGGHNNTKTRFRRYRGDGTKPLLEGHDLTDKKFMIEANRKYSVTLVAKNGTIQYYRDGILIYDFKDEHPYTEGWFGIRTVNNHMLISALSIYE